MSSIPEQPSATANLRKLVNNWGACQRCRLCETRHAIVWWRGSTLARTVVIGEAPGADEDATGVPFVGKAGQHLNKLLTSVGIKPAEDIFITNMIMCRPPNNRTPEADEIQTCWPRLAMMLTILKPAMIVLLGLTPAGNIINEWNMGKAAGRFFQHTIKWRAAELPTMVMPTYHPSYLMRMHDARMDQAVAEQIKSAVEFGRTR